MSYIVFNIVLFLLINLTILSLYLTYKVEHLENEKQSLINASRRSLANAERQVSDRNRVIEYQEEVNKKLQSELIMLKTHITSNNYGSLEIKMRKLNELVNNLDKAN